MPKYAAIDIGTNAIKFHLAEKKSDGTWSAILDQSEVTRLGAGLHQTGKISEAAVERNIKSIKKIVQIARDNGAKDIVAVGTMALRTAKNASDFIKQVAEQCGIKIEIIDGEEEARLSFLAVTSSISIPKSDFMIFDIGGGSTEFILCQGKNIKNKVSLNIGVVRLTEQILKSDPVTEEEFDLTIQTIEQTFNAINLNNKIETLIGVGATMTILGAMKLQLGDYQAEIIHGSQLELSDVMRLVSLLKSKTIQDRKKIIGLLPDRADVILPGAMIVVVIMKKTGMNVVTISDRGVRQGLLLDRFR